MFIRGRWVRARSLWGLGVGWIHAGAPCVSSGSFGVVGFTRMRPGGRRDHSVSFGSLWCALVVVVFIQGGWVHAHASFRSSGSFGVFGFTGIRPVSRRVHSGSFSSLGCALGTLGFIWDR